MSYKLCLCMIVRNEAHVIQRCLESVRPWVDYWVICDTGSTDATIDLVRESMRGIPGELHRHEWRDFAHNRNRYLELAEGKAEYVLVMDADQVLEARDFDAGQLKDDVYHCIVRYQGLEHRFPKVFRPETARYRGVIHNYVRTEGSASNLDSLVFLDRHDGHRSKNYRDKLQRDIAVLEEAVQGTEDVPRYTYYLAQTCKEAGDFPRAIENYLKRAEMGGWAEEVWSAWYNVGRCHQAQGRFDEALAFYLKAFDYRPSRAEPLYRAAEYARTQKRYHTGLMLLKTALAIPYPARDTLFVETDVYAYLREFEYAILAYWTGDYAESIRMANRVDSMSGVPEHYRRQNRANREFAISKAASQWALANRAHAWILEHIPAGATILELGSGAGSIKLAERYKVFSVEHNEGWLNLSPAVQYIHAPIREGWYDRDILAASIPGHYDLVIVDGPPAQIGRHGFLHNLGMFRTGCPILVDDVNRPDEMVLLEAVAKTLGREYRIFADAGKRFGVIA